MQSSTDAIPFMDFKKHPELRAIVGQYELAEYKTISGTDQVVLPYEKETADIKAHLESELLTKTPLIFPTSLLINRVYGILDNKTLQVDIEPDAIEQLQNYLKHKVLSDRTIAIELSRDEKEFCNNHDISQYMPVAIRIIKHSFSKVQYIHTELLQDPETEEQWLVINVEVKGEIEDILDMYDRYAEEWVSSVPWPNREKIVLTYTII